MVFYRTKGDYVPAVLKTQILFQLLIKHRANKRDMVFLVLIGTMLDLL